MKRMLLTLAVLAALAGMAACGGGKSNTSTAVTVTLSPTSASASTGQTVSFTATVANSTNTAVTWQVNGITGGTLTFGTISTNGLYSAPSSVPNPNTVTVTAISQADTSKSAQAVVTITATTTTKNVVVSPSVITVPAGGQQSFSATVSGQSVSVNWSLSCRSQATGGCGSITAAGVYSAPLSPPPGVVVNLTATTTDNSALPAGAVITVQFSNGSLQGQYAFSFSGRSAGAAFAAAGSISFDGSGNITGGVEDVNGPTFLSFNITGGSYNIGTDGRGNAVVQTQNGTEAWQFALVNHAHVLAIRFDTGSVTASGALDLQDATQFNLTTLAGNYAFRLAGSNLGAPAGSLGIAGALSVDSAGTLQGVLDVNNAGAVTTGVTLTGTAGAPSAAGRGTLAITSSAGSKSFAYYIVDGTHLKLLETDLAQITQGDLVKQPAGPFSSGSTSLRGAFAFTFAGASGANALGLGGIFVLDGAGNLSSGTADINNNGNWQNGLSLSGTYSVSDAATGRTTATLNVGGSTLQYVLYPQTGGLIFLEVDASNVTSGVALAQAGLAFSAASLQANYALILTGTDLTASPGEEDIAGQLIPNGGSTITGTVVINDNSTTSPSTSLSGSYGVSVTGRGTATLQTTSSAFASASMNLYLVDTGTVLFLESDSNRVLTGSMQKQY